MSVPGGQDRAEKPAVETLVEEFVAALRLPPDAPVPRSRAEDAGRDLLARWSQPHRRYHTTSHLAAVLAALELLLAEVDVDDAEPRLAAWYHDAVYAGRPGDDEEASALLAERELTGLGLPPSRVDEVARLVRLTATHRPAPDDVAGQLLCDSDLSVLGSDPDTYRAYARAVREEYAHLGAEEFRAGRAIVLARLAAADRLFATPPARRLWEARARANLAAELESLTSHEPSGPPVSP